MGTTSTRGYEDHGGDYEMTGEFAAFVEEHPQAVDEKNDQSPIFQCSISKEK